MSFAPRKVKQSRVFLHIVSEIERAILDGSLNPGDQLPPELELKEMFGTGRGAVREALRVLEEKGLVVIRAGATGGAFVQEANPAKLTEHLDLLVQSRKISADNIQEFREAVEPMAASLAAQRADKKGIAVLEKAFSVAEKAIQDGDQAEFLHGDVAVHVAIAELTGNPLLVAVLRMVHEQVLDASDDFTVEGDDALRHNLDDLRGLVNAVVAGNTQEAGRLALDHIRTFHCCMKAAKTA